MKNRNLEENNHWRTPPDFYNKLNDEFKFDFDPCPWYHDLTLWDGLKIDWGQRNFVNPPYSRILKPAFVMKAIEQKNLFDKDSIFVLPVSTSTDLFHDHIEPNLKRPIKFERGRIPFIGINKYGQYVNYHLIGDTDKHEIVIYEGKELKKYIKAKGQHDTMTLVIGNK